MKLLLVGASLDISIPNDIEEYYIIAIDGGYKALKERGITPDFYVGDRDTYSGEVECKNIILNTHKDWSDMEKALIEFEDKYDEIVITGALGGRLSHTLGNLSLLSTRHYPKYRVIGNKETVFSLDAGEHSFDLSNYSHFSFYSLTSSVVLSLKGFEYPLDSCEVKNDVTLGLSNVPIGSKQIVEIKEGKIIVVLEE